MIERLKDILLKYAGFMFCILIIFADIFIRYYDVVAVFTKIFMLFMYFSLTSIFLIAMFKAADEKTNMIGALVIPVFFLGAVDKPLLLISLIGILFFYAKSNKWKTTQRIALCLYMFIYCIVGGASMLLSGFSEVTILQEITSPNREYTIILKEIDAGATGGAVFALVKENNSFIGVEKKERRINQYQDTWGARPNISWVDNEIVSINGKEINIYKDLK